MLYIKFPTFTNLLTGNLYPLANISPNLPTPEALYFEARNERTGLQSLVKVMRAKPDPGLCELVLGLYK